MPFTAYHGTSLKAALDIKHHGGFIASTGGRFGAGVYVSASVGKAAMYASRRSSRGGVVLQVAVDVDDADIADVLGGTCHHEIRGNALCVRYRKGSDQQEICVRDPAKVSVVQCFLGNVEAASEAGYIIADGQLANTGTQLRHPTDDRIPPVALRPVRPGSRSGHMGQARPGHMGQARPGHMGRARPGHMGRAGPEDRRGVTWALETTDDALGRIRSDIHNAPYQPRPDTVRPNIDEGIGAPVLSTGAVRQLVDRQHISLPITLQYIEQSLGDATLTPYTRTFADGEHYTARVHLPDQIISLLRDRVVVRIHEATVRSAATVAPLLWSSGPIIDATRASVHDGRLVPSHASTLYETEARSSSVANPSREALARTDGPATLPASERGIRPVEEPIPLSDILDRVRQHRDWLEDDDRGPHKLGSSTHVYDFELNNASYISQLRRDADALNSQATDYVAHVDSDRPGRFGMCVVTKRRRVAGR